MGLEFAKEVKYCRTALTLSVTELSARSRVSEQTIRRIELGKTRNQRHARVIFCLSQALRARHAEIQAALPQEENARLAGLLGLPTVTDTRQLAKTAILEKAMELNAAVQAFVKSL